MSDKIWYSITTPEQLIEAVKDGLHVECVRHTNQVRIAVLAGEVILLKRNGVQQNDARLTDRVKLRQWFAIDSQYTGWKALDTAGRIPYRDQPI